jgi:hypothetical protein
VGLPSSLILVGEPDLWHVSSKAVPNGALAWSLDQNVTARVNKYHYGTTIAVPWRPHDPEIASRSRYLDQAGDWRVNSAWSSIVHKVNNLGRVTFRASNAEAPSAGRQNRTRT